MDFVKKIINDILKYRPSKKATLLAIAFILGFGTHYLVQDFKIPNLFSGGIESATEKFSIAGTVKSIGGSKITIEKRVTSKDDDSTITFRTKYVEKVETNRREPINLEDIKTGDKIIVQGLTNKDRTEFFVKSIIYLNNQSSVSTQNLAPKPEFSTTTPATKTETE